VRRNDTGSKINPGAGGQLEVASGYSPLRQPKAHIRCGHDIEETPVEGGFIGDYLVHAIPYCVGPVTKGSDRHELIARFLAGQLQDEHVYQRELESLPYGEKLLHLTADDYERVVIWMEHDNFDQLVLVRLLAHYANAKRLLWPNRKPVTSAQLALKRGMP